MFIQELAGPKIVLIDDAKGDIDPLINALNDRNINNVFIDARPEIEKPTQTIDSVKLIFLDLYFYGNTLTGFDPTICADIIQRTVPEDKQYYLVIFSNDTDQAGEVIDVLQSINLAPVKTIVKQKTKYNFANPIEVDRLLDDLNDEFDQIKHVDEYYGEIISIEEDVVTIDCLLINEEKTFQLRRFEYLPLSNLELIPGKFVLIRTITKLGSIIFEFSNIKEDLSSMFNKDDYFKDIDTDYLFQ